MTPGSACSTVRWRCSTPSRTARAASPSWWRPPALSRTTAHRLLRSLVDHELVALRDGSGLPARAPLLRFAGDGAARAAAAGRRAPRSWSDWPRRPARARSSTCARRPTGLHRRRGVATELRTIVSVGASLPLTAGSAGKVFLAFDAFRAGRGSSRSTGPPRRRRPRRSASGPSAAAAADPSTWLGEQRRRTAARRGFGQRAGLRADRGAPRRRLRVGTGRRASAGRGEALRAGGRPTAATEIRAALST